MGVGHKLSEHGLSLNNYVFCYCFYCFAFRFLPPRLLLIPVFWRWNSHRGEFRGNQQVGSQLGRRGRCVVNGCSVGLWCSASRAPWSTGSAQHHCSQPPCHLHGIAHGCFSTFSLGNRLQARAGKSIMN